MKKNKSLNSSLKPIENYLNSKQSVINHVTLLDSYNDFPRFFQYATRHMQLPSLPYLDTLSNGISQDEDIAIVKAVMETVERWYLASYNTNDFIYGSYNDLKKRSLNAINPTTLSQYSKTQLKLKKFSAFNISLDSPFYWTKANKLFSSDTFMIPAHIINFMSDKDLPKKLILISDSSGAAAGTSVEQAVYNGICELIERDAYTIMYYNFLPMKKVDFSKILDKNISDLLTYIRNYYLDVMVFEITLDINVPIFFSVTIDTTGMDPQITVGAKCSLEWNEAMYGAILESFQGRSFLRDLTTARQSKGKRTGIEEYISPKSNEAIFKRFKYWAYKENRNKLDFLLKNNPQPLSKFPDHTSLSYKEKLKAINNRLRDAGIHDIFWVKTTPKSLDSLSIYGVKVVIPALQRISLDADLPYFGYNRMYEIPVKMGYRKKALTENKLNPYPHPLP